MFSIAREPDGRIVLTGRLDAGHVDAARALLATVEQSCSVDFAELDYISSAGLGLLLAQQRRLIRQGQRLRLVNLSRHLRDVFVIAGFDRLFEIV